MGFILKARVLQHPVEYVSTSIFGFISTVKQNKMTSFKHLYNKIANQKQTHPGEFTEPHKTITHQHHKVHRSALCHLDSNASGMSLKYDYNVPYQIISNFWLALTPTAPLASCKGIRYAAATILFIAVITCLSTFTFVPLVMQSSTAVMFVRVGGRALLQSVAGSARRR